MGLSEVKRKQILDAATAAFQQQGYLVCSMDGVAEQAQVSKRTIYNHFDNKDELFIAVIERVIESMHPAADVSYDSATPIRVQLLEIVSAEIELMQSEDSLKFFRMLLGELLHNPKLTEVLKKRRPSCEIQFDTWLRSAIKNDDLQIDDEQLAKEQLFGLIKSQAFWPSVLDHMRLSKKQKERLAESTVTMFLRCYQKQ